MQQHVTESAVRMIVDVHGRPTTDELGFVALRDYGDIRAGVCPIGHGNGRLCINTIADWPYGWERGFCYESPRAAIVALLLWDGVGEPTGWFRCLTTGRRRPDGDPAREHIWW